MFFFMQANIIKSSAHYDTSKLASCIKKIKISYMLERSANKTSLGGTRILNNALSTSELP